MSRVSSMAPALLAMVVLASAAPVSAQSLTFNVGSTHKVQQLVGGSWPPSGSVSYCVPPGATQVDIDWETGAPLLNQTYSTNDLQVGGCDLGYSFEGQLAGKRVLFFLCGDTLYFNAQDAVAVSKSTHPAKGLKLEFLSELSSVGAFLVGNHVSFNMGVDNVPEAGISIGNDNYVVLSTGHEIGGDTTKYSILTHFDGSSLAASNGLYGKWDEGRVISSNADGDKFTQLSLVRHGGHVYMFGTGTYRASDVYLARTKSSPDVAFPANEFWTGGSTQYFKGLTKKAAPTWTSSETDPAITPIVFDNPSVGGVPVCSPYPADCPTIGNLSVQYVHKLGLWVMTYDGGRQQEAESAGDDPNQLNGIYFSWAKEPWGPWSQPVRIFNADVDGAYGHYIFNPDLDFGATGGPEGPTINPSNNDPCSTRGGNYAPYIVKPFIQVQGSTLTLYYNLSTWNPYTIVLMSSTFTIGP